MAVICEEANLNPILAAVIAQAVRDLRAEEVELRIDAALWLSSQDAETWLVSLGIERDPAELLAEGKRIIRRLSYARDKGKK